MANKCDLRRKHVSTSVADPIGFLTFAAISDFELCHAFTNYLIHQPACIQGVRILVQAVEKIRLLESGLTAVHADLCQLCLYTKVFNPALKFLDVDITSIATTEVRISQGRTLVPETFVCPMMWGMMYDVLGKALLCY